MSLLVMLSPANAMQDHLTPAMTRQFASSPAQIGDYSGKYAGQFTNQSLNASGSVVLDISIVGSAVSGYINFTNNPGGGPLCGAGNFSGTRTGDTIQFSFTSSDSDPGCTWANGLVITVSGVLSGNQIVNGAYTVSDGEKGIFSAMQTTSYTGRFTTLNNRVGSVSIDLASSTTMVAGFINFTNDSGAAALCGSGSFVGTRNGESIQFSFLSNDPDAGCTFDKGLIFNISGTVSGNQLSASYAIPSISEGGNLSATSPSPSLYAVSGRIIDGSGNALTGVTVSDGTRSAMTDNNGNYTLSNVPAGTYTLTPSRSGYSFSPTNRSLSVSVNVLGQDFTATQVVGSLSGKVTSTNGGVPLVGAAVSLGSRVTSTATDGTYTFNGVQPGSYPFIVTANGYGPSSISLNVAVGVNTRDVQILPLAATGFRVPTSPILSYRQQDGVVNSVTAYFDLSRSGALIHDAAHTVGSSVLLFGGRRYTAPWPMIGKDDLWRVGVAYNGHVGTDYNGRKGDTNVIAAAPGYVLRWRDGSPNDNLSYTGNTVWMRHPDVKGRDLCVFYHHLSPNTITAKVRSVAGKNILLPAGEVLAKVGNSGYSFGAHLHFEVYDCKTNAKIDPYSSGLMEGWIAPTAFLVADPPPPLDVSATASDLVVAPNQTIALNAQSSADVAQYRWVLDTGEELAGQQANVSFADAGTHVVWTIAIGVNGEAGLADPLTITVTPQAGQPGIDTTAPDGSISAAVATATTTTTLRLTLAVGEPTESTKVRFSADGVTYTPWEQFAPDRVWNLPADDGDVAIFAQFADAAGNSSSPTIAVVQVDRTAPTISVADPMTDSSLPWEVTFSWNVDDLGIEAHGQIQNEYMLVGVDNDWQVAGIQQQAVYKTIPSGTYTMRVRVTDLAGNATTVERPLNVVIPPGSVYLPLIAR